jgi:hypothetical protein
MCEKLWCWLAGRSACARLVTSLTFATPARGRLTRFAPRNRHSHRAQVKETQQHPGFVASIPLGDSGCSGARGVSVLVGWPAADDAAAAAAIWLEFTGAIESTQQFWEKWRWDKK